MPWNRPSPVSAPPEGPPRPCRCGRHFDRRGMRAAVLLEREEVLPPLPLPLEGSDPLGELAGVGLRPSEVVAAPAPIDLDDGRQDGLLVLLGALHRQTV